MTHVFTAQIVNKHRITIPKSVRDLAGLKVGDFVYIHLEKANNNKKMKEAKA